MYRQFEALLLASESNSQARRLCEEAFTKLKSDVLLLVLFMFLTLKMINSPVVVTKSLVTLKVRGRKVKGM